MDLIVDIEDVVSSLQVEVIPECLLLAESAISVKPPKAVASWLAVVSDRQLWGATTIACFRPVAVIPPLVFND